MTKKRVVILGGGFAGLTLAQRLKKSNYSILLVDHANHHLFQPLLYQVATAALSPADIAAPLRQILKYQKNTEVIMAEAIRVDLQKQLVKLSHGESVDFDILVIATGASHYYFDHPEWEKDAPGLKTLHDALTIRENILLAFEEAEKCKDLHDSQKFLRFVIVGGGPTGVELAGAIAEISRTTLFKNFRRIKPENAEIYLIEALDRILPTFPVKLANRAKRDLEKMGVHVMTSSRVLNIQKGQVTLTAGVIEAENVIWAAGNRASPLLRTLDVPLDSFGRVVVEKDLSIPSHPFVFVLGDAACVRDKQGDMLPAVAPVAIQQGRYLGNILKKQIPPTERKSFKYVDKGLLATIGKSKAVAVIGKLQFAGLFAWLLWSLVHVLYLVSFRSRVVVMFEWMLWYISGRRTARLIEKNDK